jgi:hypothetical protein
MSSSMMPRQQLGDGSGFEISYVGFHTTLFCPSYALAFGWWLMATDRSSSVSSLLGTAAAVDSILSKFMECRYSTKKLQREAENEA